MMAVRQVANYSARAFFILSILFLASSPVFWLRTQVKPAVIAAGYDNAPLYQHVYPSFYYGFGRIRGGELPLWNDSQLCGTPFQANPASVIFQPLHLIFAVAPVQTAFALHGFTCLALAGLFFTLFMRSLGCGYLGAALGGIAYAFSGAASAAAGQPSTVSALAWAPLLFWALRQYADGYRHEKAALAGIAGGLLILSGAAAVAASFLALAFVYGLLLIFFPDNQESWRPYRGRAFLHRVEGLALAGLLALGVSAVQWVPTLVWAWSLDEPLRGVFTPHIHGKTPGSVYDVLAQIVTPRPGNLPQIGYIGAISLLAVPAAFFHVFARRDALFFVCGAFVALGAAASPVLAPIDRGVITFPLVFSLAALSALGFDRLFVRGGVERRPRVWLAWLSVLLFAGLLLYAGAAPSRGRVIIFLALMAPVIILRFRWVSFSAGAAVGLFIFADLVASGANAYAHPYQDADFWRQKYGNALKVAEEQSLDARVVVSSHVLDFGLPSSAGMLFPLRAAGGFQPLTREQTVWWRRLGRAGLAADAEHRYTGVSPQAHSPLLLNHMAVRTLLAAPDGPMYAGSWARQGPPLREVKTADAVRVFVNDQALARAYWTPSWQMAEGVAAAADLLAAPDFPAGQMCVVDRDSPGYARLVEMLPPFEPGPGTTPPPAPPDARCRIESDRPERVVLHTSAPQPGVTVLSDTAMPGWHALLDGRPVPILRVNGIFRGVATPAGSHEIIFEYRPVSYAIGLAVSLATLSLLFLGGLAVLLRR